MCKIDELCGIEFATDQINGNEEEEEEEEEEDLEPLPPGYRFQGTSTPRNRSQNTWMAGGTPLRRKIPSTVGRRRHFLDISSDMSQESQIIEPNKRSRFGLGSGLMVGSSPPSSSTTASTRNGSVGVGRVQPPDSDATSVSTETRMSRKQWRREFIPENNIMIFDVAKLYLQAEVLTHHPWPNSATIEALVRRSWTKALDTREEERRQFYNDGTQATRPTKDPDPVCKEIVSPMN